MKIGGEVEYDVNSKNNGAPRYFCPQCQEEIEEVDLNQFVISLISSSHADFPLWMSVLSGNSSDKKHFREVIQQFSKELSDSDTLTYFVMDSAMVFV